MSETGTVKDDDVVGTIEAMPLDERAGAYARVYEELKTALEESAPAASGRSGR